MKQRIPGLLGHVHLKVTIAAVLSVIGAALLAAFHFLPESREQWIFVTSLLAGLSAIYAAFYVAETLRQNIRLKIMHNTFELLSHVKDLELTKIRVKFETEFDHSTITPCEMYAKITSDLNLSIPVIALLNLFEGMAIAAQQGYADEAILYQDLGFLLPRTFYAFLPYIKERRVISKNDTTYCEMEKLANAWQAHKLLTTGREIKID